MGAQLVGALHREARAREWLRLTLWTRATNQRARRLYVRSGYRTTRRTHRLRDGDEIVQDELLLEEIPEPAKPSSPSLTRRRSKGAARFCSHEE
jgi:ribosomal protein S18 acetylase RimI-like enzyme